jgi:hypothetical protein
LYTLVVQFRKPTFSVELTLFPRTGMFWQPFEAVKDVESRLGMGQPTGPIGDAIAVSHSELEVQNLSVRHIFQNFVPNCFSGSQVHPNPAPAYAKARTDRSNEQVYFKERFEGYWEIPEPLYRPPTPSRRMSS